MTKSQWFAFWSFMLVSAVVGLDNFFAQPYFPGFYIGCAVMFSMGLTLAGVSYSNHHAMPLPKPKRAEEHYTPTDEEFYQHSRGYAAFSSLDLDSFVVMVVQKPVEICQTCGRPLNVCRAEVLDLYLTWREQSL